MQHHANNMHRPPVLTCNDPVKGRTQFKERSTHMQQCSAVCTAAAIKQLAPVGSSGEFVANPPCRWSPFMGGEGL